MSWETLGEAFDDRELKKERREGVEHYVYGQHHAEIDSTEDGLDVARLTYVGPLGLVAVSLVRMPGGDWELAVRRYRVLGLTYDYGIKELPDDWELIEEMREALKLAEAEKEAHGPSEGYR